MTTPLALAQARHQQALAALADAEAELLAAMKAIEPTFTGTVDAMQDRKWESKLEGIRPFFELSQAYSTYCRARRAEAKAKSAAHRARYETQPPAGSSLAPSAMTAEEVMRGLVELRAA